MVIDRVEERQMQDRRRLALTLPEAHRVAPDGIVVGFRPALATRHDAHSVRPQRIEFARLAAGAHRLDIGVTGNEQMAEQHLAEGDAALTRIGPLDQRQRRMLRHLAGGGFRDERQLRRRLGDQAHAAMHHRIAFIALARQGDIVARRPDGPPGFMQGDKRPDARALLVRRGTAAQVAKEIEHGGLAVGA